MFFPLCALSFRTPDEKDVVTKVEFEAVQVKKCVNAEAPTNTITQENGPLTKLDVPTAAPSPRGRSQLAENSTTARDEDEEISLKDDERTGLLQCTLNSPQKKKDSDDLMEVNASPENMNSSLVQEKPLGIYPPLPVEGAVLENHTGIEAAAAAVGEKKEEDQSSSAPHPVDQEMSSKMEPADAEAASNCCEKTEASFASRHSPIASLVSEEMESPSW